MKTTILFQRHGEHRSQVLIPEDRGLCVEIGRQLASAGVKVDRMILSPLPRAVATALATCEGLGTADMPLALEPRMGDFKSDPRTPKEAVKALKAAAVANHGDDSDANMAKELISTTDLHDLLFKLAEEGAEALIKMATDHPGETILVISHGVARMEIVLRYLRDFRGTDLLQIADELIDRGQVVEVIFDVVLHHSYGFARFISAKPWTPPSTSKRRCM
ncbi:MAG: hypothetical protein A2921_00925 [Candidatus Magasanikbacteria bacterium RIFCSPLOWO2_01_FULL_43_20b]|uniref:Phosphoglycerate mutase n=1 Tax=Candidatus Magasanikbacteria bacterium RIFCSPLOWO2_12_FULL_43_12 TaxID=1798692 RepID=A0A1F6MQW0_9BACT|nr:MAG: hypothetical protein A3I93_02820 [Candidatus Magasanikbacteria bacterium RIFCSPLOWO2_02_FULL_43_22]OGH73107.1 MAG: hypothetical protein A2921_00925 [Candidatus Magasanikbacteria bacterium RIFCSPLOWO2_01_FULL_43_20b]OGH73928.1 MAG: hypothetical protein A3G00_03410 [Candidatus Magasanikbacteria bacterium RIFCSPLOWO2_12_FULL_43_12]